MKRIYIIILAAFVLGGCVTKPYQTPQTAHLIDSLYRILENEANTERNVADISWRDFFSDETLSSHIEQALENNIDKKVAHANLEKFFAQYRQSKWAFFPTLALNENYSYTAKDHSQPIHTDQTTAQVGWEIDIWGKLSSAKRATLASVLQQEDVCQALNTTIIAQIATLYYTLIAYDDQVKVIEATIANRKEYLETTRSLKESAKVTELAVQQAVAQLAEVEAALPRLQLAIIKVENAFRLLQGRASGAIVRSSVDIDKGGNINDIGFSAQVLINRPDVRAAENAYRAAHEMWNVSRAAMYPSFTISANGNITDITNAHFGTLNLLAGLTQPIFNGRKLRTQKETAKLSAEQAEFMFHKAILTAGQEVSNALATQLKTKEIATAQQKQLQAYKLSYEYSMELFMSGYATYLDVLLAQTGVYNIEMSLSQTYLDRALSKIELYRALGGGQIKQQ